MKLTGDPIGPSPLSSATNPSQGTAPDPTTTEGTTDGTDSGVTDSGVTDSGTTTGEPADPTTGVPTTTTNVTTTTTTSTTSPSPTTDVEMTTEPPDETNGFINPETDSDSDSDDSQGFIPEPTCGVDSCTNDELCVDIEDVPTCLATCDPLNLGSCDFDEVCASQGDFFVCAPDASGPTGEVGDGCAYANGCDLGNICLGGEYVVGCNGNACCSPFCDLDLADPCIVYGMQCVPWFEQGMAPPGHEDLGVCIVQ